jgi:hypothetical protein
VLAMLGVVNCGVLREFDAANCRHEMNDTDG